MCRQGYCSGKRVPVAVNAGARGRSELNRVAVKGERRLKERSRALDIRLPPAPGGRQLAQLLGWYTHGAFVAEAVA